MDPEMIGHTLDLGRSELQDVMNRYSGRRPLAQGSLLSPPGALVVGEGDPSPLQSVLEEEGWSVSTCRGPSSVGACPVMRGRPCPLRAEADVAVVFVGASRCESSATVLPLLRCAAEGGSPAVIALKGRMDDARYDGRRAAVGALRGPVAINAVVRTVAERAG